jgi:acetyltransferase-like isoleucine patch superfamily enzyme
MKFTQLPYYEHSKSLQDQIKHSSSKRKQNKILFIFTKVCNHILEQIAYSNPINNVRVKCHRYRGVKIGTGVMLGMGCVLDHAFPEYITMEDDTALAGNVYLICHSNPYSHFKGKLLSYVAPIVIKKGAWVGINATILPGVTIGENSVVSAGAVVSQSVPPNCIVAGNPAKVIREFKD